MNTPQSRNQDRDPGPTLQARLCAVTVDLPSLDDSSTEHACFAGIYASTVDATLDAMDRFPNAQRVSVRVMP